MNLSRRTCVAALGLVLAGCMTPKTFSPKDLPPDIPLMDPPAGKAVIYLLRVPHDSASLPVYLNEKRVVTLPAATYSIVVVEPGTYSVASSIKGKSEQASASTLTIQSGERRFLYVSAATGQTPEFSFLAMGKGSIVPLVIPTYGTTGARIWKECSALDAQGFMSISRQVTPD